MKQTIPKAHSNVHDYPGQVQPVVAVWPSGKVAGFFDSIKAAVDRYGFSRDGITNCCRGRQRLCGGLNWFYEKDYKAVYFSGDTKALKISEDDTRNADGTFKRGHHNYKGRKRQMTPEFRENRRANMLRQHALGLLKDSPRHYKPVVEIETGQVFPSIGHAAIATGYTYAGLRLLLKNTHKAKKTGFHYCLKSTWDRIPNKI